MFLKGNTVALRALEPGDADLLYHWENDQDLWSVSFTQIPFSKFVLEEFVNAAHQDIYTNKQLRLMVQHIESGHTIGTVDLFDFEPRHLRSGLGIYITDAKRQQGCATEAIALAKHYAFNTLLLKQVYVHVNSSNAASLALFEKAGFEKSGLKKCWNRTGQQSYEDVWFLQCIHEGN
jgi:diamine N-acetyltransferase